MAMKHRSGFSVEVIVPSCQSGNTFYVHSVIESSKSVVVRFDGFEGKFLGELESLENGAKGICTSIARDECAAGRISFK